MLGTKVTGKFDLDQKVLQNRENRLVYEGIAYVRFGKKLKMMTAYFLGESFYNRKCSGIISAVLEYKTHKRLIITDEHTVCYKPEIIDTIKMLNIKFPIEIQCLYEKSCGAVIYKLENAQPLFLLIKNTHARHWSFPKGHIEGNESERRTALREIKEETGLQVRFVNGFRQYCEYTPFANVKKHVVMFLAEAKGDDVKIQKEEISQYIWADFDTAINMFKHQNDIKAIRGAYNTISKQR